MLYIKNIQDCTCYFHHITTHKYNSPLTLIVVERPPRALNSSSGWQDYKRFKLFMNPKLPNILPKSRLLNVESIGLAYPIC